MKERILLLIATLLLIASCGTDYKPGMMESASYDVAEYGAGTQTSAAPVVDERLANIPEEVRPQDKKKIIKSGRMGIRTKEPGKEKARIDLLVGKYGGYYARDKFNDTDWESTFDLSIRIPVSAYEKFIVEVASGEGSVLYKEIDARDVTEQFVDIEARLANKRSYLARYRDFVKQAKTIKEVLEIEEQIRALEEEIESAEGRLRYMSDQASYSTLDLVITYPKDYRSEGSRRDTFWYRLVESVIAGWRAIVEILLVLIRVWPFWIVVAVAVCLWRRKYVKKKGATDKVDNSVGKNK